MRYEVKIGWRYLYGGRSDGLMLRLGLVALGGVGLGAGLFTLSHGSSALAVVILVLSMILAAAFFQLAVFSVFTSVSVLGVVLGVAALTFVLAITTGFEKQFRDKVLGVNAHVIVLKSQATFAEYRDVMKTAREIDRDVLAVQPFIFAEMLATRGKGELSGVAIKGIDPKLVRGVLDLDRHMIEGSVDSLLLEACPPGTDERTPGTGERPGAGLPGLRGAPTGPPPGVITATEPDRPRCLKDPPIIMGKELAHKLKARIGDTVTVVVPLSNIDFDTWRAKTSAPRTRKFTVTGIFYSGFDEYDRRLMYASLTEVEELQGRGDQVMGVELKVRDVERAEQIAHKLEKALGGPPYQVQDWYELNHNLFTALTLQKLVLVLILTLIIVVAAVNMVSALTMLVMEKVREIAILKSMGASSSSVAVVFQVVGIAIGGAGTVLGVAIGLVMCYVASRYGYRLDPKVYLIDRLPIEVKPLEVLLVAGITMAISLIATVVPARSAAALRPVDGLRYD
ncbi:MAG TPA: ABC transporter permease [Kofleriaceae bacterium]